MIRRAIARLQVMFHVEPAGYDRCETCGEPQRRSVQHDVTVVLDADEFGGTSMTATYCPKHCPGGCANPKHPRPKKRPEMRPSRHVETRGRTEGARP